MRETFYISHGSPTLSIDKTLPARHFLESFQQTVFSEKPKSILVVSGHWETDEPAVTTLDGVLPTIYDFYNFPKAMYEITYPLHGSPTLARRVVEMLADAGFKRVDEDGARGLDHGAWVPLMLMYPEADIPVCQLSVQPSRDAMWHYKVGRALAPLKEEGVLIMGSGATTHNLRTLKRDADNSVAPWAMEFDTWLKNSLLDGKYEDVNNYVEKAPHTKLAHPHPDHFYPLHVAMGAAGQDPKAELIHTSWGLHTLSYSSYKFTSKA